MVRGLKQHRSSHVWRRGRQCQAGVAGLPQAGGRAGVPPGGRPVQAPRGHLGSQLLALILPPEVAVVEKRGGGGGRWGGGGRVWGSPGSRGSV